MPAPKKTKTLYDLADEIINEPEKISKGKPFVKPDVNILTNAGRDSTPDRNLLLAQKCKLNLFFFLKTFWSEIIPEDYVDAPHIEFICKELQFAGKRVIER